MCSILFVLLESQEAGQQVSCLRLEEAAKV